MSINGSDNFNSKDARLGINNSQNPIQKKSSLPRMKKQISDNTVPGSQVGKMMKEMQSCSEPQVESISSKITGNDITAEVSSEVDLGDLYYKEIELWKEQETKNETSEKEIEITLRVIKEYDGKREFIDFSNIKVKSLPNVFFMEKFEHVKRVYIQTTLCTTLPQTLCSLPNLEIVFMEESPIVEKDLPIFRKNVRFFK